MAEGDPFYITLGRIAAGATPRNEKVCQTLATTAIATAHDAGDIRSDSEILKATGLYPDASAYWRVRLATPMRAVEFADLIFSFQPGPMPPADWTPTRMSIEHAVCEGLRNGATWIFRDPMAKDGKGHLGPMRVRPMGAALWLLSSPWSHLAPKSLKAFLETEQRAPPPAPLLLPAPADATPPRRGRPDDASRRVVREMRDAIAQGKLTPRRLSKMSGKSLAAQFDACRETCVKARKTVLSENADK